jgi:hypothetical protein
MVESFNTRSGHPSLRVDGIALHSPYDPVKEAERFAKASVPADHPSTLIFLGEGLGYGTMAMADRFPAARIIPIFYSEEIFHRNLISPTLCWHPGETRPLSDFLRAVIGELDVEGLRIVEWPPSALLFPERSQEANRSARHAVQEANGGFVTTVASGKAWLRNTLLNFLSIPSVLDGKLCSGECPVLIAASGPSLAGLLPVIRRKRLALELWALPSSLLALRAEGISPDLVVMTDPSPWSMAHLDYTGIRCPIAMPLSAARGSWRFPGGVFLLSQPSFFEKEILDRAGLIAPLIPPHGTVTASALDLAAASTHRDIFLAGLDLCFFDILSHARPNASDRLMQLSANRLTPHYSLCYQEACRSPCETIRADGQTVRLPLPLRTYTGWLGSRAGSAAGAGAAGCAERDIFRLSPSPVDLPSTRSIGVDRLLSLAEPAKRGPRLEISGTFPSQAKRKAIVHGVLEEWQAILSAGIKTVKKEGAVQAYAHSQALLSLSYILEARTLAETRRKARLGFDEAAREAAVRLLDEAITFLSSVREKVGA